MKKALRIAVVLLGLIPLVACATIMKGSEQDISFTSEHEGARVSVYTPNGMLMAEGDTPVVLPLEKGDGYFKAAKYKVVFEVPGYQKKELWLTGSLEAGWYIAGNFLVGGWIGWLIVDPITGAMWTLKPNDISAKLSPAVSSDDATSLHIVMASQVPAELMTQAVLVLSSL